ncbi:phage tail assembly protein [Breoghania sp. L-A4]|uniref:phage tail assembly protein n=1 Tax=Breoghania sp. L-A4 TaxID=2304600 RepID=UPI0013C36D49|nr:phage tail assembly protein [Breoghania sp. L-A4]
MTDVSISLSKPIEHEGKTVTSMTFHEASLGDLAVTDAAAGGVAKTILLLAALSGQTEELVRKIKAVDLDAILEKVEPLTGNFFKANG